MLDCCEPLEKVKEKGISFGKLVCLAHCAGAKVEAFRTNHSTLDEFRKLVLRCSSSDDCHMISSYHRGAFKQVRFNLILAIFPSSIIWYNLRLIFYPSFNFFRDETMWIIVAMCS